MKKNLLIILSLIFMGHASCFAMYCWEEMSTSKTHTSAMTSKLGASNIVKVSTFLTATYAREVTCKTGYNGANYYDTTCSTEPIGHNVSTAEYENGVAHGASTISNATTGYYKNAGNAYPVISVGGYSSYRLFESIDLGYGYNYGTPVSSDDNKWKYWYGTTLLSSHWYDGTGDYAYYHKSSRYLEYISPYYTHTFCTTAGGGGGGAAGAAVNYIIKAD